MFLSYQDIPTIFPWSSPFPIRFVSPSEPSHFSSSIFVSDPRELPSKAKQLQGMSHSTRMKPVAKSMRQCPALGAPAACRFWVMFEGIFGANGGSNHENKTWFWENNRGFLGTWDFTKIDNFGDFCHQIYGFQPLQMMISAMGMSQNGRPQIIRTWSFRLRMPTLLGYPMVPQKREKHMGMGHGFHRFYMILPFLALLYHRKP